MPCISYPPFPLFSYFSVAVYLRWLLHHILSLIVYTFRENREFVLISIVQFVMNSNSRMHFVFVLLSLSNRKYELLPIV